MIRIINWILSSCLLIVAVLSCSDNYQLSNQNLSQIYRSSDKQVMPEFVVYHNSEDRTDVHFKLKSTQLLYTRTTGESEYQARIKMTYVLYRSFTVGTGYGNCRRMQLK